MCRNAPLHLTRVGARRLTLQVAEKIIEAHQLRIPPSRRMAGYRPAAKPLPFTGRPSTAPQSRAIIFEQQHSTTSYADRAYFTDTMIEAATNCQLLLTQLDSALRSSRPPTQLSTAARRLSTHHTTSHHRKTLSEPLRNLVTIYENGADLPGDDEIADKLAASDSQMQTRADLIKMYGRRKADKVLAGKLALEDGKAYDMSLIRACYDANKREFWLGSLMLLLGCESCHLWPKTWCWLISSRHPNDHSHHHSSHHR